MNRSTLRRTFLMLATAGFAAVALATWLEPRAAAGLFGLDPSNATGVASIRADLGGLFAALTILCGAAAFTRGESWPRAAAVLMGSIVAGRAITWFAAGPSGDVLAFAVELTVLSALLLARWDLVPAGTVRGRRWWLTTAAIAAAGVTGIAALPLDDMAQRLYDRGAERMAGTDNTAPLADDALRIAICGSSAPLPSADRAKACVAVFAGGKFYIVDAGPESVENLVMWGIPLTSIGGVFLTHFHSDHIGDLGELNLQTWAAGRKTPLAVYGGPGVERVVDGFNTAYRLDQTYRTAHHTAQAMPPDTWPMAAQSIAMPGDDTGAMDRSAVVLDDGALKITAFEVDHSPIKPAYAYRFDYKGRSAFVTGDLKLRPSLANAAQGVDVMISEAIATSMTRALGAGARGAGRDQAAKIMHDIEDYHITPEQSAQVANEAGVKLLVFYHLLPAPDGWLPRKLFTQGIDRVRSFGWSIADDGSLYTMPIGTADIVRGDVMDR